MKFLVITDAPTLKNEDEKLVAYAPYVNEMDIWMNNCNTTILSPIKYEKPLLVKPFKKKPILKPISALAFNTFLNSFKSLFVLPKTFFKIFKEVRSTDHIHLRCPGNIGLLGCFVQVLFPSKPKTVKYAGNWDPKSKQPLSYKIQKWILSNTILTKNCKVLVYGEWKNQSKNIIPFFTASYYDKEIEDIPQKDLKGVIRFIFVGTFSKGKQPMLSVNTIEKLVKAGKNVRLDMYGNGELFDDISSYVKQNNLNKHIYLHGNQSKNIVKSAFQKAHFLIFISKSEGWPKVVAEAMFWGCLPISTIVSCVPYMLANGKRGVLVKPNTTSNNIANLALDLIDNNENRYLSMVIDAKKWSQRFTLDYFEEEIKKLLI